MNPGRDASRKPRLADGYDQRSRPPAGTHSFITSLKSIKRWQLAASSSSSSERRSADSPKIKNCRRYNRKQADPLPVPDRWWQSDKRPSNPPPTVGKTAPGAITPTRRIWPDIGTPSLSRYCDTPSHQRQEATGMHPKEWIVKLRKVTRADKSARHAQIVCQLPRGTLCLS